LDKNFKLFKNFTLKIAFFSKVCKSHQRKLVDGSDPFYRKHVTVIGESHQRQLVDGSDPFYNLLLFLLRRASRAAVSRHLHSRQDLNYPPTAVGGICIETSAYAVEKI